MKKILLAGGIFLAFVAVAFVFITNVRANDRIPGQYIVVLKDNFSPDEVAGAHGVGMLQKYEHALKGFAAQIPDAELGRMKSDPRVAYVSEDRIVSIDEKPTQDLKISSGGTMTQPAQVVPTGVSRLGFSASDKGTGIGVAVIDTGIYLTHPDLHVVANTNCVTRKSGNDDNGHGTHVSGTIGALDNSIGVVGVAPGVNLVAVKVLNSQGSGTWSQVICGIDWVTANASKYNIKIANMSLGGSGTSDNSCGSVNGDALHQAICNSRNAGVTYVVAAGNNGGNASQFVPAAYDDAVITVSALADSDGKSGGLGAATSYGPDDTFATFSNYGSVVDLGAPGVNILSTWLNGGYNTLSGTSMATPHVTGAAALYIQSHPGSTWTQVRDGLKALGEVLGAGHTDPSGLHPELVVQVSGL